jgi:hypothetical protein
MTLMRKTLLAGAGALALAASAYQHLYPHDAMDQSTVNALMTLGILASSGAAAALPASYTFNGSINNTATYANAPLGAESPTRVIVVAMTGRQTGSGMNPTGCTLGGTPMTLGVDYSPSDAAVIYYLPYPTGSTANVVPSWSSSSAHHIAVYSVYNAGTAPITANGASGSAVVNANTDDIIIACAHKRGVSSATWTGVTQNAFYSYGGYGASASILRTTPIATITNSLDETAAVVFRAPSPPPPPAPAPSWRNSYSNLTALTAYTFPGCDFGPEHPNRVVAIAASMVSGSGRTISSVTIGGIAATLAVTSASGTNANEIWYAVVPTGATGDVIVTWSGSCTACGIQVWSCYPASPTPVDAIGNFSAGDTTRVLTDLAKTAGGFAVFATRLGAAGTVVLAQNGVETIVENFDGVLMSSPVSSGAMSFEVTATSTADDFTATFSTSSTCNLVGATWGPPA